MLDYKTGMRAVSDYFTTALRVGIPTSPSPAVLCNLATWLATGAQRKSGNTVRRYLDAYNNYCLRMFGDNAAFTNPTVLLLYKGIVKTNPPSKRVVRYPITTRLAAILLQPGITNANTKFYSCFAAAACLGVRGLMRPGEFSQKEKGDAVLRRSDVKFFPNKAVVRLCKSKTDQVGKGHDVILHRDPVGSRVCAVHWLEKVFEEAYDKSPEAPLFQYNGNNKREVMTYSTFGAELRRRVQYFGLNVYHYTPHGLRIGGASDLAFLGFSGATISTMGRWRSHRYTTYTRPANATMEEASRAMAGTVPSAGAAFNAFSEQLRQNGNIPNNSLANSGPTVMSQLLHGLPESLASRLDFDNIQEAVDFFQSRRK